MLGNTYPLQECALARSLEVVGERWTLLIVRDALYGIERFGDFQARLDIPKAVLSARLTSLVDDGIMERLPDPSHAGRHLYRLTAAGRDLWPVVHAMLVWGDHHREPNIRTFTHADCGTRLDDHAFCPQCRLTPPPQDVVMTRKRGRGMTRTDPASVVLREPRRLLTPVEPS
jgi:DNA-binding HxlR family transcriptional regulator